MYKQTRLIFLAVLLLIGQGAQAETASLTHDDFGNITQRTSSLGTTAYTYDALNRLKSESFQPSTGLAQTQNFTYDADGNRLSDGSGSYTYDPNSNKMLTTRQGVSVITDPSGRITSDGTGRTYTYNQAGQLYTISKNSVLMATYHYNAQSQRTRKVITASAPQGAQTVVYHYDQQGHLLAETSGTGTAIRTYVWRDDTPIAQIEHQPSRKIIYYETDHLNTPRVAMDEAGKVVWRWESDAFGSILPNEDPDGDGVKVTVNQRFPGQYFDMESGLNYNYFRTYDASMGRYTQSDPIGLEGGDNTFAYVDGNPLSGADPLGLSNTGTMFSPLENMGGGGTGAGGGSSVGGGSGGSISARVTSSVIASSRTASQGVASQSGSVIKQINPKNLIPQQTACEMSGSVVKRLRNNMKANGFDPKKPVLAVTRGDGRLVISDGHHRTAAAIQAGISTIPVVITP